MESSIKELAQSTVEVRSLGSSSAASTSNDPKSHLSEQATHLSEQAIQSQSHSQSDTKLTVINHRNLQSLSALPSAMTKNTKIESVSASNVEGKGECEFPLQVPVLASGDQLLQSDFSEQVASCVQNKCNESTLSALEERDSIAEGIERDSTQVDDGGNTPVTEVPFHRLDTCETQTTSAAESIATPTPKSEQNAASPEDNNPESVNMDSSKVGAMDVLGCEVAEKQPFNEAFIASSSEAETKKDVSRSSLSEKETSAKRIAKESEIWDPEPAEVVWTRINKSRTQALGIVVRRPVGDRKLDAEKPAVSCDLDGPDRYLVAYINSDAHVHPPRHYLFKFDISKAQELKCFKSKVSTLTPWEKIKRKAIRDVMEYQEGKHHFEHSHNFRMCCTCCDEGEDKFWEKVGVLRGNVHIEMAEKYEKQKKKAQREAELKEQKAKERQDFLAAKAAGETTTTVGKKGVKGRRKVAEVEEESQKSDEEATTTSDEEEDSSESDESEDERSDDSEDFSEGESDETSPTRSKPRKGTRQKVGKKRRLVRPESSADDESEQETPVAKKKRGLSASKLREIRSSKRHRSRTTKEDEETPAKKPRRNSDNKGGRLARRKSSHSNSEESASGDEGSDK